ncbi:MAG: hypothetical protein RL444_70 [Verrucomicrobiota bacterium]|jgi:ACS family D-galactonate transporter-like MFS transporter
MHRLTPLLGLFAAAFACAQGNPLPDLPDPHGRGGMAAVTVLDDEGQEAILAAGGCNFPDGPPWDGGTKRYYRDILLLSRKGTVWTWKKIGELPKPVAYAAFAPTPDRKSMVIAGGCDEKAHHEDVWRIGLNGEVDAKTARLPGPRAFAGHAYDARRLVIVGGSDHPDATTSALEAIELDLRASTGRWKTRKELGTWGILPLTGLFSDGELVGSGCVLMARDGKPFRLYGSDLMCGTKDESWRTSLERPIVAAAGPGVRCGKYLLFVGGDDGSHYPRPPKDHPGLSRDILAVDRLKVRKVGTWPEPIVTAPLLRLDDRLVTVGGEDRPGHRTAKVSSWILPEEFR